MANKNKIAVKILGQDHYLISTDEEGYVERVAKLVDDRMQTILKSNSALSHTKIAILTSLNLADDLSKARKKIEEFKMVTKPATVEISETKKQITSLTEHVSQAEGLYDNILNEFQLIKSTREEQEKSLRALTEKLRIMCGDMAEGDDALERAMLRITDLEEQLLLRESEIAEYIKVFDELENEKLRETQSEYTVYDDDIVYEDDLEE